MNRHLLQRALELGFTEIGFTSTEGPAVCRDGTREYLWALLDGEAVIPAANTPLRSDSTRATPQIRRFPAKKTSAADHPNYSATST